MKVGDLIRFKKEHWNNPGFTYCKNWMGLICCKSGLNFDIYWVSSSHGFVTDIIVPGDNSIEVISEGR